MGIRKAANNGSRLSLGIGVYVNTVKRQLDPNRLDIVLSGSPTLPDLESLCLSVLREAAGLRYGFELSVDTRNLCIDDPSMAPILSKVFGSLQWFGISQIVHRGRAQHLDSDVQTLYGATGLLGSIPLQIDPC